MHAAKATIQSISKDNMVYKDLFKIYLKKDFCITEKNNNIQTTN